MECLFLLANLLSFYAYLVVCFDISPMAAALAAGFVLLETFLGWLAHQAFQKHRIRKADGPAS